MTVRRRVIDHDKHSKVDMFVVINDKLENFYDSQLHCDLLRF